MEIIIVQYLQKIINYINYSFGSMFLEIFPTNYVNEFGDFELASQKTQDLEAKHSLGVVVMLLCQKSKGNEYLGHFLVQLAKTSKFWVV